MNAVTRVFGIQELLELVLSNCNTRQLFGLKRVSASFNSTITSKMNPATRVFGIPALLKLVLSDLPTIKLFRLMRVSASFNSAITHASPLRTLTPEFYDGQQAIEHFLRDPRVQRAIDPFCFAMLAWARFGGPPMVVFNFDHNVRTFARLHRLRNIDKNASSHRMLQSWRNVVLSADRPFELRLRERGSRVFSKPDDVCTVFWWEDLSVPITLGCVLDKLEQMTLWAAKQSK